MPLGSLSVTTTWRSWGSAHCLRQAVRHSFERARVPDLLYCVPVLGLDGVVLVDDRHRPRALGWGGCGVVAAEARRAHE